MSNRGNPRGRGQSPARGSTDTSRGRGRGRASPALSTTTYPSSFASGRGRGDRGGDGGARGGGGRGFGGFRGRGGGPEGPLIFRENVPANLPPQLEPHALQQLVNKFKSVKVKPERPLRPGYGTVGTEIKLRTNFFAVKLPTTPVFDYVVDISPQTDINRLKTRIFQLLERSSAVIPHLSYIAHDRSQRLVSAKKLPQPLDIAVPFYDDHETSPSPKAKVYQVSIKFERELQPSELTKYMEGQVNYRDYDPLPLSSALNLVLQQHASRTGVRFGKNRHFFPNSLEKKALGPGLDAVQGFYISARPGFKQLLVNVNFCMTAFVKVGNLADKLLEFSRSSRGTMPTLPKGIVKSIRVRTLHLGYRKKLLAIGSTSARNTYFDCAEMGGKVSVEQYFAKKYKKTLRYPTDLPVVNIGSRDKPNWVPAELCEVEDGNVYRDKLNDRETAEMIRHACNKPRVNAENIVNKGFPSLGLSPLMSPVTGFGISVDNEMLVVPGREFPPPGLAYSSGRAKPERASWNILDVKFQRCATVTSWWVLYVADGQNLVRQPDDIRGLVDGFAKKMRSSGMSVQKSPDLLPRAVLINPFQDPERKQSLDIIRKVIQVKLKDSQKPSFILILLENRDNFIYPGIKRIGDVELGVHTIHMQLNKANDTRKQDQYFSNVALKVNTKLGGMNHLLDPNAMRWLTKKPTMMVGIDVTHPGPGSREGTPSIAAVVASVDKDFVQFPASLRIQETKKEMLDELEAAMIERLRVWEQKNKTLPERIFVYRDGVSEGQYDIVLVEELPQILKAFRKFNTAGRGAEYKPKLSIIVCGKRHHAKFFPENSRFADRNGNTRPGTVVDKGITGVFDFDFYLQAHAGLQGHTKSTHYTVVYDENGLTADDIQQGTHDVSYLYARATKAVSLIPAAYYADLACERGRCYLNDFLVDDKSSVGGGPKKGGSGKKDKDDEQKKVYEAARRHWGEGLHPDMRGSMFYI